MTFEAKNRLGRPVFSETFSDEFSVLKNGGTPTDVSFEDGKGVFDGSSKIEYGIAPVTGGTQRIIKAKIKTSSTEQYNTIIAYGKNSFYERFTFALRNGLLRCEISGGGVTGTKLVNDGLRHTVIFSCSSSSFSDAVLYIDGEIDTLSTTFDGDMNTSSKTGLVVGNSPFYLSRGFDGEIDLVEIYNYARTSEQVSNDYNNLTYKDVRDGLVLDIDSRQGVIEDKFGSSLTIKDVLIKKDSINVFYPIGPHYDNIKTPFSINGNITVCFWIKSKSTALTYLLDYRPNISFYAYVSGNNIYASPGSIVYVDRKLGNSVKNNGWSFVTISNTGYNGSGTATILTNYAGSNSFNGYMQQFRQYNKVLSINEKTQLYTNQKNNYE